jgi:hypothetical protein
MGDDFDPSTIRLDPGLHTKPIPTQPSVPQMLSQFLRGPVPLVWLAAAGARGLNALRVGLAIWQVSGKSDWAATVSLTSLDVERLGLRGGRPAKLRALRRLKRAGLITTKQTGQCAVEVTILKASGED